MEKTNVKDDYKFTKKLGEGSFGVVRKAVHKQTGEEVAIKIISKTQMTEQDREGLHNEINLLKEMDHPNIVKLFKVYEDSDNFYLVMEVMTGGELFDVLIENEHFSEKQARDVITPIIDAIHYCHQQGIVHRDIKPENLLFSKKNFKEGCIKVSDFGLARTVSEDKMATTTCGTPGYVAPEILEQKPYGKECDFWSIGIVLYILLSGIPPFYEEDNFALFEKIKNVEYDFNDPIWKSVSKDAKDIIKGLLVADPSKRLTCEQLLAHEWIKKSSENASNENVLSKMKNWNSKRKMIL